jgi:hypothetical protein
LCVSIKEVGWCVGIAVILRGVGECKETKPMEGETEAVLWIAVLMQERDTDAGY